jgi:CRP-like cAMP-binding protein
VGLDLGNGEHQTRNTDASAIAPTKLLSIGAENFEKIRAKKPELAAKVLFNLSRSFLANVWEPETCK